MSMLVVLLSSVTNLKSYFCITKSNKHKKYRFWSSWCILVPVDNFLLHKHNNHIGVKKNIITFILKMLLLCFVSLFRAVISDWVEIPQSFKYQRNMHVSTEIPSTTTMYENATYFQEKVINGKQDPAINFLSFIGMIQDSLLATENKTIKRKTLFLKHLRDDLLINIGSYFLYYLFFLFY